MILHANGRIARIHDEARIARMLERGWKPMEGDAVHEYGFGDGTYLCTPEMTKDDEVYGYQITFRTFQRALKTKDIHLIERADPRFNYLHCCPPHNVAKNVRTTGNKRALISMWETEDIDPNIAPAINENIDVLFVPAPYLVDTFKDAGVTVPIEVTPLGIQEAYFDYKPRKKGKVFKFIHWNSGEPRKGYYELIEAWTRDFKDRDDVELILKYSTKTNPTHIYKAFTRLGLEASDFKNITFINEPYSLEQMLELVHSCHALIYPSCGEGYGYTPREAMATGLPVIMVGEHSFRELPKTIYTNVKSKKAQGKGIYRNNQWYQPNVDDITKQMNKVIDKYSDAVKKAKLAYEYVDKHEHIDYVTDILIEKLKKHGLII